MASAISQRAEAKTEGDYIKCPCSKCDILIEFPAHGVGETIACPYCEMHTVLFKPDADSQPWAGGHNPFGIENTCKEQRPRVQQYPNVRGFPICRMPMKRRRVLRPGTGALRDLSRVQLHFVIGPANNSPWGDNGPRSCHSVSSVC